MFLAIRGLALVALLAASAVAPAQSINDAVQAYAWADNSNAASYTPNPDYSYSASGGAITAARSATGQYSITFEGVPAANFDSGNVQVSAYATNAICSVNGWSGSVSLTIAIACFNPATLSLVDSPYTVLFTRWISGSPRVAYAFANESGTASYTPDPTFAYNAGGGITITRTAIGSYQVTFAGIEAAVADVGNVQVSAYGTSSRCLIGGWGSDGSGNLVVDVRCYAGANPFDSRFNVLFVEGADAASRAVGYAWANDPAAASYSPSSAYVHGGGTATATRSSAGRYTMSFSGIGSHGGDRGGTAQVTPYGGSGICTLQGWSSGGTSVDISVFCYDGSGAPVDAQYQVLFLWPDRVSTASETVPDADGVSLAVAGPNPSRAGAGVAVTLREAADARVRVLDALGREVAVLHDGPLAAGTTALPWRAGALSPGTYLVWLEVGAVQRTARVTLAW